MTEARFLQHLIGKYSYRGLVREGGLLRLLGAGPLFHDEATNAPRACPHCKRPLRLPRNPPGFPDILAVIGRTLWFLELKSDRGHATPAQEAWIEALAGVRRVRVRLIRPRDLEGLPRLLVPRESADGPRRHCRSCSCFKEVAS